MQREWRVGDIVKWWFTDEELKRKNHGNNNGTTYWCCSNIAVMREDGCFHDTFWNHDNKKFAPDKIGRIYEVDFIANFDELEHVAHDNKYLIEKYRNQYDPHDIVDLNHSNNSSGNFYVRRGAKKKIDVMRESYQYNIENLIRKIESLQYDLKETKKEFESLTEENSQEHKIWI